MHSGLFTLNHFFCSRTNVRSATMFAPGGFFTCNGSVRSSYNKKNCSSKQYIYQYVLHFYSAPNFFLREAVVVEPGRSNGKPSTLSHNKEASTPNALETPNSTV